MSETKIPFQFMAGTTLDVVRSYPLYPSTDYTAALVLINSGGKYTVNATAVEGSFNFYVDASGTSAFVASDYQYNVLVSNAGDTYPAETGTTTVTPNIVTSTGLDTRSDTKKLLDVINTELQRRLTGGAVVNYSIDGRSIQKMDPTELVKLQQIYLARYNEELRIERGQSRMVKTRYKDLYEPLTNSQRRIF